MKDRLYIFKRSSKGFEEKEHWKFNDGLPISFDNDGLMLYDVNMEGVLACVSAYEYVDQMMGERYVSIKASAPFPINWSIGDWLYVKGEKFTLGYIPEAKKLARKGTHGEAFLYDGIKFNSIIGDLTTKQFLDYSKGDNLQHYSGLSNFSFYVRDMWDIAYRLQANLDRCYPGEWRVEVKTGGESYESDTVAVSSGTTIYSALALVNSRFNQNFSVRMKKAGELVEQEGGISDILKEDAKVITIGGKMEVMPEELAYGAGNGLKTIQRASRNSALPVTRLHAYGNTKNLPYRYYNRKYARRNPDGSPVYPEFWENGECIIDKRYFPNLMLPKRFWQKDDSGVFNVFVDATTQNFAEAGYDVKGIIDYEDPQYRDLIVEMDKTFTTDDKYYDDVYPTIREAVADDLRGCDMYLTGYSNRDLTIGRLIEEVVLDNVSDMFDYTKLTTPRGIVYSGTVEIYEYMSDFDVDVLPMLEDHKKWVEDRTADLVNQMYSAAKTVGYVRQVDLKKSDIHTTFRRIGRKFKCSAAKFTEANGRGDVTIEALEEWSVSEDILDKVNAVLRSGYISSTGMAYETIQYVKPITDELVEKIKANTYGGQGRLDRVLTPSVRDNRTPILDNGVSSDGGGLGSKDIHGNIIIDDCIVTIPQICFNINDWVEDNPKIAMRSGKCAGREFTITKCVPVDPDDYSKGWELGIGRIMDSDLNIIFPNRDSLIEPGDEFVLLGIRMPDVYVGMAENRLFRNAMKYLKNAHKDAYVYVPELDSKWMKEHKEYAEAIRTGVYFRFRDEDINNEEGASVALPIKQLTIKVGSEPLPKYEIQLDNGVEAVSISQVIETSVKTAKTDLTNDLDMANETLGGKLSKVKADTAREPISFEKGLVSGGPIVSAGAFESYGETDLFGIVRSGAEGRIGGTCNWIQVGDKEIRLDNGIVTGLRTLDGQYIFGSDATIIGG